MKMQNAKCKMQNYGGLNFVLQNLRYDNFKFFISNFKFKRKGQAALPTIVLLGGLMVEVVIAGALVVFLFNNSTYGTRLSIEAFGVAHSGIQDALLKISLDKNLNILSPGYSLSINSISSANIVVERDPIDLGVGKTRITSVGTTLIRSRKLQAILNINNTTGSMKIESLSEILL